ncbi:hypothetical protein N9B10_07160 [Pirellulales bacterium]|nr:hypothetical protein [Pirellulales bacterium]
MKELVYKSDFAGIEPGTLQHETICAIARQFSSEPTPKHASLLLSVLLREANAENTVSIGFAIDDKGGPQECNIRAIWQELIAPEQFKAMASPDDRRNMRWRDESCIKEIFLAAAMALEDMNADTMFRFCQFICFFLEHRLGEGKISKIAGLFHTDKVEGVAL